MSRMTSVNNILRDRRRSSNGSTPTLVGMDTTTKADAPEIVGSMLEDFGLSSRIVMLTPRLAKQWIERLHTAQRKVRKKHLQSMVRDIKAGRWRLNGQPIVFDKAGNLVDGQHRVLAVIESDMAISAHVLWGIEEAAYASFDITSKRSGSDALRTRGISNAVMSAAAIRMIMTYNEVPDFTEVLVFSPNAIDEFEEQHPEMADSASVGRRVGAMKSSITGANAAAAHFLFSKVDRAAADAFFERFIEGDNLGKHDPILILRNRALSGEWRPVVREQFAYMFRAWSAFRAGKEVKILRWTYRDEFPSIAE